MAFAEESQRLGNGVAMRFWKDSFGGDRLWPAECEPAPVGEFLAKHEFPVLPRTAPPPERMHLQITPDCSLSWDAIETIHLRYRLASLATGQLKFISQDRLSEVRTEMEARSGHDVLQVGPLTFVPLHAVSRISVEDQIVELISRNKIEIEPSFSGSVRAFCESHAPFCHS